MLYLSWFTAVSSSVWITGLAAWGIFLWQTAKPVDYKRYSLFCAILGILLMSAALVCLCLFLDPAWVLKPYKKEVQDWVVVAIVFWSLAPPAWFFLEYFAVVTGKIKETAPPVAMPLHEKVKTYAEYSSKLWAAVLVLYLLILDHHLG